MNSVNLIGRLTKDPESARTADGTSVCTFTLAVDDILSEDDRADFIDIKVPGRPCEPCERYLRKGFLAGISGRIRSEAYTDTEGIVRSRAQIVADSVRCLQWPERAAEDNPNRERSRVCRTE
jgi:single-strand DNA-binding protein